MQESTLIETASKNHNNLQKVLASKELPEDLVTTIKASLPKMNGIKLVDINFLFESNGISRFRVNVWGEKKVDGCPVTGNTILYSKFVAITKENNIYKEYK